MSILKEIPASGLVVGTDGIARCYWREASPFYRTYHDFEWGTPIGDDDALFERICLEGFQSGLSWLTVLRKRDAFRKAFAGFKIERVAAFTSDDVARLMGNAEIIRNRAKIEATINNAKRAREVVHEDGNLGGWLWRFEPPPRAREKPVDLAHWRDVTQSPASTAMSIELKRRGFAFVGPTTCYAVMQAIGMVNDHLEGCAYRAEVERRRHVFVRPAAAR